MMQCQPDGKKQDENKFFNYIELFDDTFQECEHCNKGQVTLLVNKHKCDECNGQGYKVFPDIQFQKSSINYFNSIWKSNHKTKSVTEIVQFCKVPHVVSSAYLKLKDEHNQFNYPKEWTDPLGYKKVISSIVVLKENDKVFKENSLDKLLFCLNYHCE